MNRLRAARLLVLALASSAGVHAALAPAHAAETPLLGAMFALAALTLAGVAQRVDRAPGPVALAAAVLLLCSLLVAYAATRSRRAAAAHARRAGRRPRRRHQAGRSGGAGARASPVAHPSGPRNGAPRPTRRSWPMSSTTHTERRRSSLPLAALVAVASAALALALAGGHAAQGHSDEHTHAAKKSGLSEQRLAFHDEMRRLWEDHITWTRLFIVSASADLPDTPATDAAAPAKPGGHRRRDQAVLRARRRRAADHAAPGAHHRRRRPARGGEGGRPSRRRAPQQRLVSQRQPDRGLPQ